MIEAIPNKGCFNPPGGGRAVAANRCGAVPDTLLGRPAIL
jgi:hypothetical protein